MNITEQNIHGGCQPIICAGEQVVARIRPPGYQGMPLDVMKYKI